MFRRMLFLVPVAAIAVGGSTACATKKFVRTSVGQVNDKVDSLGRSVEQTQERTRKNEARIAEVDQKAQSAATTAQQANGAAADAKNTAADARSAANTVGSRLDTFDNASKRLVYEVVLSEDQGNFKFGKADLPDGITQKIDEMVAGLKQDPKNVFIEVEGHTDDVGSPEINEKIGLERAQAVQRYLYERHQIPLHKINIISYGASKPAVPNTTKSGRAQNRRVVIRVLA